MKDLQQMRASLNNIDTAIMCLFAERFKVTEDVGVYKKEHQLPPVDEGRENQQFERISQKAEEVGLDPEFARKILRLTIDEVVKNHKTLQGIKE